MEQQNIANQVNEKQEEKKQKIDKACSQQSINYGYLHYVFNSPAVPRK